MAKPRPLVGLGAGLAAGLVAAGAMALFQRHGARLIDRDAAADPGTGAAKQLVIGAALGGIYGLVTEYQPEASGGFGTALGTATAMLLDEAAGTDVAPATTASPMVAQATGAVSHLVYGMVLEGVRTLIAGRR